MSIVELSRFSGLVQPFITAKSSSVENDTALLISLTNSFVKLSNTRFRRSSIVVRSVSSAAFLITSIIRAFVDVGRLQEYLKEPSSFLQAIAFLVTFSTPPNSYGLN